MFKAAGRITVIKLESDIAQGVCEVAARGERYCSRLPRVPCDKTSTRKGTVSTGAELAVMPIDYSKWKEIEVSDDEDDTHPNIDTPSLFRWRHQARLERMAEKKLKQEQLEKEKSNTTSKLKDLQDRLAASTIGNAEKEQIQKELDDVKEQEAKWRAKEKELEDQERLEPWNVDTIGHESFSTTRINKIQEPKSAARLSEEEDTKKMADFCEKNEGLLQTYGRIHGLKATEDFLTEHPHLACEYAANYLTIECLNLAIDRKEDEMCVMAEQCVIMQYLLELAKSLKSVASNVNLQRNFFKKFGAADPTYVKSFHEEVEAFQDRLRKRATEKREAATAEYEAEEKARRIAASPGGLDPQEVFDTLPEEMQKCFESQDVGKLKSLAQKMDEEVFMYHFRRCIDSGLWVPERSSDDEGSVTTQNDTEGDDGDADGEAETTETESVKTCETD
ncbi:unnamed protein product [Caenorhabditis auriculariae]|uniref:Hsp90 chaperone protein kinase-targeting subunit n=1 Tax=Caenorhabditis auriculariae TaxID=2777116 RepID=A0A8S1H8U9_9PELO|nr:unnamed protein product [Caenorhabditis auriculariae]